jgi:hypothetical protein
MIIALAEPQLGHGEQVLGTYWNRLLGDTAALSHKNAQVAHVRARIMGAHCGGQAP